MKKILSFSVMSLVLGLVALTAQAQVIYSTGFDPPTFTLGSINTQDGWANGSGGGVSNSIVNTFFLSGPQSLRFDNTTSTSFYSVRRSFNGQNGQINSTKFLRISSMLFVDPSSQANRLYGIYATNAGTGTLGSTALGLTVSGTGQVRAGTSWGATYGTPLFTSSALVGRWIRVELQYDGIGGSANVYDAANNLIYGTNFASVALANANGTGTNSWSVNLGSDFTTGAPTGVGYFDNFYAAIPEPSGLGVLALGMVGLLYRRRLV